jgi:hypothetical protein
MIRVHTADNAQRKIAAQTYSKSYQIEVVERRRQIREINEIDRQIEFAQILAVAQILDFRNTVQREIQIVKIVQSTQVLCENKYHCENEIGQRHKIEPKHEEYQ